MTRSVRERYAFTVGTNLLRGLLSFVTGMLLARWLGPDQFGAMAFLLGTFLAIRQLLDMGSSMAFFTFMSQRLRSRRFVFYFFGWLALQFTLLLAAVGLLFPSEWVEAIWQGEQRGLVLLAFAAAFMQNSLWPVVQQASESQRRTLWVQSIAVIIWTAHLAAVTMLWLLGLLGLYAVFAAIAIEYLLAAIVAISRLSYAGEAEADNGSREPVLRKFLSYCAPLIPYAWVGFAYEFADRWLLQNYGGSVEQAYYQVGARFATISLVATTSILRIFWKEIAEAEYRHDHERAAVLFRKVSRSLFLMGAVIAGFLIPWTEDLLLLLLGSAYAGGALTLSIMLIYPVHQSLGQICGTMLYATERVWFLVTSGIVYSFVSIVVTYLLLAVLGLEAEGLAIKMVALQLIQVNVLIFIVSRIWKRRFDWIYQPVSLAILIAFGWLVYVIAGAVMGNVVSIIVKMLFAGFIYMLLTAGLVYSQPWLAGMERAELMANAGRLVRRVRNINRR